MINKFLSKVTVDDMTGLSNVTRWRMEKRGEFPKRRQISPNRVAYLQSEIIGWMETRPESDIVRILSPWFMKAKMVPTRKATLAALGTTWRENAREKKPSGLTSLLFGATNTPIRHITLVATARKPRSGFGVRPRKGRIACTCYWAYP